MVLLNVVLMVVLLRVMRLVVVVAVLSCFVIVLLGFYECSPMSCESLCQARAFDYIQCRGILVHGTERIYGSDWGGIHTHIGYGFSIQI